MWQLRNLYDHCNSVSTERNGKWVPARPIPMYGRVGLWWRVCDAWAVLRGRAESFLWPEGQ